MQKWGVAAHYRPYRSGKLIFNNKLAFNFKLG